ncbi:MAG: hypothetical protein HKP58_00870 [Desulfatitalea sp.]|nr:cysteine rich repeat-containing protein [Desulfatitalea sp.]NNJ98937.1 hypothetical protein [Desulfatitalea sp.]
MKSIPMSLAVFVFVAVLTAPLGAQENLGRRLVQTCKAEIETYCHDVKPGGGRILSCLHAHSDKLSESCAEVAKEAGEEVKLMGAAIAHVKENCSADLDQYCKGVAPGRGRLLKCLQDNDTGISHKCKDALKEIGLRE